MGTSCCVRGYHNLYNSYIQTLEVISCCQNVKHYSLQNLYRTEKAGEGEGFPGSEAKSYSILRLAYLRLLLDSYSDAMKCDLLTKQTMSC